MSLVLEKLKSALNGIDLGELKAVIAEAERPTVNTVAETAWIYNGYQDISLNHVGIPYKLPYGQITKINAMPNYKEVDQNSSTHGNIVYRSLPLKGEQIARELIDDRGFEAYGLVVLLTDKIDLEVKEAADQRATAYKKRRVEEFKVGREKAKAGVAGYKISPDPNVYAWLQEFSPDDALFADQATKTEANNKISAAIELMAKLMAGKAPPPVEKPRNRKPMESKDEYRKYVDAWQADFDAIQAEGSETKKLEKALL